MSREFPYTTTGLARLMALDDLVVAAGIRKVFQTGEATVEAVAGVDLRVAGGEFLGIMGPSGSGKSTLMYILGCLDRPTEGSYALSGRNVLTLSDRELSELRASQIGFVFQNFNLIPECTVLENVALPFVYQGLGSAEALSRAQAAIQRVGLSQRFRHKPSQLSGGEMQRAAIARAIVIDPLLVLADEPTGNLDSGTSERILSLFARLNDEGTTIVAVTHDPLVASYCSRVVHLLDGRVVHGEPGE